MKIGKRKIEFRWSYIILTIISFLAFFPFYMMFVMGTYYSENLFRGLPLLVSDYFFQNLETVLKGNFLRSYMNSIIVSVASVTASIFTSVTIGYAIAKYEFKLRGLFMEQALKAYFHPEDGIGYSLCRTHMGSCDFCTDIYSYNDYPGDIQLERFSVEYDEKWLIPMIKKAKKAAGGNILLHANPWSPPAWMKSNASMENGGRLLDKYYSSMAMYFVKYITEYKKHGIDIWGITTQNEPDEIQKWPSCCYSAQEEKKFIKEFLVPLFRENGLEHINIMIWDSNKDKMYERSCAILEDKSLHEYIKGIAFHWYSGDFFEQLDLVHNKFPKMMLISSENCVPFTDDFNDWSIGERYGHEIIGDINHWTNGFIDWNMFLNEYGGPNLAGNYCAAPIHVDTKNGQLIFLNSYYYIGHFSKFLKQNALRVECLVSDDELEACAVKNSDGQVAAVIMNRTNASANVLVDIDGEKYGIGLLPHSIITIIK